MTHASQQFSDGKEKLVQGTHELIEGAEDLLRAAASYTGEGADAARSRLLSQVDNLKNLASSLESSAQAQIRRASARTDGYVRAQPWQAVGIAAVSGLVIGALLSRR